MPSISMFFGIVIYMYWNDHDPPHFHAVYQGGDATFDFHGNLLDGDLPARQKKLVAAWAEIHSEELAANWELAKQDEALFKIDPLR